MTTETVLTEELIDQLSDKYLWGHAQFVGAGSVFVEGTEEFARAIEQAVLQSPEMKALRKDAKRYRWLRDGNGYYPEENYLRGGVELDDGVDLAMEQQT